MFYRTHLLGHIQWILGVFACVGTSVMAGFQHEEPLTDSVRTALSAPVHPFKPLALIHADVQSIHTFNNWLIKNEVRLAKRLSRSKDTSSILHHELDTPELRRFFLQMVWYESQRAGLDPSLILGLIQIESGFRKFAISNAGARGFMQVMPFWTQVLAKKNADVLFVTQINLRFGCVILRHYLNVENGNLFLALGRYNGTRGQLSYPSAVLAAQQKWQ